MSRSARRAADLGFDRKWAIHPKQLDPVRRAFAPSPDEVAHAHAVIGAMSDAAKLGSGAAMLDGSMVDEPVRLAALRTLARGEAGLERRS